MRRGVVAMAFIPAENTARVTVVMTLHNSIVENVYHVNRGDAWDVGDLTDLANVFITWYNDEWAPISSADLQFQRVQVRDMTTEEAPGVEVAFPPLSGGDVTLSGALPGNVTVAVKHVTGLTGRSRRGRTFITGMPNSSLVGNAINSGYQDAIQAAFTTLLASIATAGFGWVVASFYHGVEPLSGRPIPRLTALLTPIIGVTVDPNVDSQRRRLTGRGI